HFLITECIDPVTLDGSRNDHVFEEFAQLRMCLDVIRIGHRMHRTAATPDCFRIIQVTQIHDDVHPVRLPAEECDPLIAVEGALGFGQHAGGTAGYQCPAS